MSELAPQPFRLRAAWILLAACLVMALPALRGDALNYDDQNVIAEAAAKGPSRFFTEPFYFAYTPVYGLSLWIDGVLGASAERPFLFHFANVVWHAAACYAVFLVLNLLLGHVVAALLGALLFAVHPLHVESVAWIAGRKDVVSGFFFFLAWLFHLKAEERRPRAALWAATCFLLACFTKASAIVLPLVLATAALLLPRYRERRRDALLATVPLFAVALVPLAVHLAVGLQKGVVGQPDALGTRFLAWIAAWGGSVQRAVVPLDLAIDYPEARAESAAAVIFPGLVLAAAGVAFLFARRRAPAAAFGIAAFFAALLPFNNVFPATEIYQADRYLYLPLAGVAAVGAWVVSARRNGAFAVAVAAVVCAGLSFWSASRFSSDEELWTRTIAARDASAVAYFNRGAARANRARLAFPRSEPLLRSGVEDLRAALARARLPEHEIKANAELVAPLVELREYDEAMERANRALALLEDLDSPEARRYRAEVLYSRGMVAKEGRFSFRAAAQDFRASALLRPSYRAWAEAGQMFLASGEGAAAKEALERAAGLERANPEPLLDLAKLYQAAHQRGARRSALESASARAARDPRVVEAWIDFWLDGKAPDYRKAQAELERLPERAHDRQRLLAKVEAQRALFLFRRGETDEALAAADAARRAGLTEPSHLYDVGQIYFGAGRYDDAVRCYRAAADVLERRALYRDAIARAYLLKGYRLLRGGDLAGARLAWRAALDAQPTVIEAGAAPLREELIALRAAKDEDLALLAIAVAAGDPALGNRYADTLLGKELADADRVLVYRLRAVLRSFVSVDFKGAVEDLQQVLARDPEDRWARYRLAQTWMRAGVGWMRTASQVGSEARANEGRALVERAVTLLTELLEEAPDFHLARLQRGEARFAQNDISGAKADYLALRERGAAMKEVYLKEAILHRLVFVQGGGVSNLRSAIELLETALATDPNYFDALFELGNVYHLLYDRQETDQEGRPAFVRAILNYRRAMSLNPRLAAPRVEWASICLKAARRLAADGKVNKAMELVERVEEDAPDVSEVHRERIRLMMRREYYNRPGMKPDEVFRRAKEALDVLERLDAHDPELPALRALYHRTRGWSFYWTWAKLQLKKQPELRERARQLAVDAWKQAIAAWPDDPENGKVRDHLRELAPEVVVFDEKRARAAFQKGQAAFAAKRWAEAAVHFREAVLLFPESLDLRFNYALALARAGRLEQARPEFERVANAEEGPPGALYELGNIYLVKKEPLVARVWFERFVKAMTRLGRADDELVTRARARLLELEGK